MRKPVGHIIEGALRRHLGLNPHDNMLEADKQIKPGDSEHVRKMKQFALNMKKK